MSNEVWKHIPGFGGHYEASSLGRIRSKDRIVVKNCNGLNLGVCQQKYRGRLLKPNQINKYGHLGVHLGVDGKKHSASVHRLVLLAFVGEAPIGMEACHANGDASDNRIDNLRWDSHFNNNQDRKNHGRYAVGEHHPMARLTPGIVSQIKRDGLNGPETAKKYGIGTSTAHRILTGRSWGHVNA